MVVGTSGDGSSKEWLNIWFYQFWRRFSHIRTQAKFDKIFEGSIDHWNYINRLARGISGEVENPISDFSDKSPCFNDAFR